MFPLPSEKGTRYSTVSRKGLNRFSRGLKGFNFNFPLHPIDTFFSQSGHQGLDTCYLHGAGIRGSKPVLFTERVRGARTLFAEDLVLLGEELGLAAFERARHIQDSHVQDSQDQIMVI